MRTGEGQELAPGLVLSGILERPGGQEARRTDLTNTEVRLDIPLGSIDNYLKCNTRYLLCIMYY